MATRSSLAAYNIGVLPLCWRGTRYRIVCRIRVFPRNDEFAAYYTISLALTDRLLISNSPLMIAETDLTPKISFAVRTGNSKPCRYTLRTRHASATFVVACVRQVATATLAARFTHIPFGHGCCHVPYQVINSGKLIVEQIQSFGCFDTPFEHDVVTI